jgi:hypothetical protein
MMLDRSIDDPPTPPPSDPIQTERKLYPTTTSSGKDGIGGGRLPVLDVLAVAGAAAAKLALTGDVSA